ncbi:unnamed protein product [Rhizophagus irregularis]|uniref:DNase I-like protein n=2 Tax=Rhizophagus irregularis TaxID=588596 RepID=A0A915ZLD8_9GLOM|nr:unnamed protein product [Rhizophagus irregularis]
MLKQCQVLSIFLKNNQNNNASSSIQHASNEQLQQTQNKHKMNSETIELAYEKRDFQKDLDNLEEIVESLTNEENVNVFLVRQRLSLLEFIEENNIDIMAISETNIDYCQEYFINQDIKLKVYSIIFSERDQKTKGSGTIWSIYATPNNQDMRKNLIDKLKMAIEGHNRSIHNTVVLHIVLGDFNDTIDNKIDRSPSTEQPGSQFLIQLSQLGLYDVCRALYPDIELFTYEKWNKNKDKSSPILRLRIDQIWITHEANVIPVEFSVHSSQMITNSHHSIISTTVNISEFIKNNFRYCVPDQI